MKPDSAPAPDENPQPRKKTPGSEKISGDPAEKDLWDLSDDGELTPYQPRAKKAPANAGREPEKRDADEPAPNAIPPAPRGGRRDYMTFTQDTSKKPPLEKRGPDKEPAADDESSPESAVTPPPARNPQKVEAAFDDLDTNIASVAATPIKPRKQPATDAPPAEESPKARKPDPAAKISEPEPELEAEAAEPPLKAAALETDPVTADFEEKIPPAEIPPDAAGADFAALKAPLTQLERSCLIAFGVLLLIGGWFLVHSLHKLPEEKKPLSASDFPIKGSKIEAVKVASYWRAPITTGEGTDTFRRGTVLLPVLELQVAGGPGAVRVFFRNTSGELVGDPVTRAVKGPSTLKIAASAGFDDLGMHAAYRAGNSKPWLVEILEGPAANAPGDQFKRLFEIPISTERR
jgi:hypothetical protein